MAALSRPSPQPDSLLSIATLPLNRLVAALLTATKRRNGSVERNLTLTMGPCSRTRSLNLDVGVGLVTVHEAG